MGCYLSVAWVIDPKKRICRVHTAPDKHRTLGESESIDGGDLLPGVSIPLAALFARVPREGSKA
jgi:hypothetical protein